VDAKQNYHNALEKCVSYNISTVAQFKLLMEEQGYKAGDKDNQVLFYRHGTEQGRVGEKRIGQIKASFTSTGKHMILP
jgi:hypothetical protein